MIPTGETYTFLILKWGSNPFPCTFYKFLKGENSYFLLIEQSSNLVLSDESKEIKFSYHFML